jgi:hypothetical protein
VPAVWRLTQGGRMVSVCVGLSRQMQQVQGIQVAGVFMVRCSAEHVCGWGVHSWCKKQQPCTCNCNTVLLVALHVRGSCQGSAAAGIGLAASVPATGALMVSAAAVAAAAAAAADYARWHRAPW